MRKNLAHYLAATMLSAGPLAAGSLSAQETADLFSKLDANKDGYVTPGLSSVAAPVLDHAGHPVAAVALTFRTRAVSATARTALAAAARDAAAEVARRIHGRAPA